MAGIMRAIVDVEKVVENYAGHLKVERGMADNTIAGYLNDIKKLLAYLGESRTGLGAVSPEDLQAFAAGIHDLGVGERTQSRIISGVKSFFKYLHLDGYIDTNPSLLLENPHLGTYLPEILSVEEIDAMIAAIDMGSNEGQRNRAIMETLYGCGLRVSELTGLEISKVFLDEEYLVVKGKGAKERLVPMSPASVDEIRKYMVQRSEMVIQPGSENILFLNRRGRYLTRTMILIIVKRLGELAGIRKTISLIRYATVLPHTFLRAGPTSGQSNKCSATRIFRPPKFISISTVAVCATKFLLIILAAPIPHKKV